MSDRAERDLRSKLGDEHDALIIRAAGSHGAIDLVIRLYGHTLWTEVKATGTTTEDGGATCYLTMESGRGMEQRDQLLKEHDRHADEANHFGFILRRKGRIYDESPRYTWHPIQSLENESVLRANEGVPLREFIETLKP